MVNSIDKTILLIDKPSGITSFDVIRILRKKLSIKKMGHAGTLDPQATGLMIIGIENGTRKLKKYIGLDKTYEAEIILGIQTDTGDFDGKIIRKQFVPDISQKRINEVINNMVGDLILPVPIYSAIKKRGKPLYKYAREGLEVDIPVRKMRINWIKFNNKNMSTIYHIKLDTRSIQSNQLDTHRSLTHTPIHDENESQKLTITLNVTSGTYIRSIAEEMGRRLDTIAALKNLRRTNIGSYNINQAVSLDKIF